MKDMHHHRVRANSRHIPGVVIVGAQKCGTTSLYYWLGKHPGIFAPSTKEPNYFASFDPAPLVRRGVVVIRDPSQYRALFDAAQDGQLCCDASVSYLWDQYAAEKIHAASLFCKIIVLVRDPVERAYSAYLMRIAGGTEKRAFDDAIYDELNAQLKKWESDALYIDIGRYGSQVSRYEKIFPKDQILIVSSKELSLKPHQTMVMISEFLRLDPGFWDTFTFNNFNTGIEPRNKITEKIITSGNIRAISKLLMPQILRQSAMTKILTRTRNGTYTQFLNARKIIWAECKEEISKLESIVGHKIPELWASYVS